MLIYCLHSRLMKFFHAFKVLLLPYFRSLNDSIDAKSPSANRSNIAIQITSCSLQITKLTSKATFWAKTFSVQDTIQPWNDPTYNISIYGTHEKKKRKKSQLTSFETVPLKTFPQPLANLSFKLNWSAKRIGVYFSFCCFEQIC